MTWLEFIAAITTAALTGTGMWGFIRAATTDRHQAIRPQQVSDADKQAHRDADDLRQVRRVDTLWGLVHHLREEVHDLRAEVARTRKEADAACAETGVVHAHVLDLRDALDNPPPWPPGYPEHLLPPTPST